MKIRNLLLFLVLVSLLCTMVLAAKDNHYVFDEADVLTFTEEQELDRKLAELSNHISMELIAVTAKTNDVTQSSANGYFRQYSNSEDGVILLLGFSEEGNKYYIQSQGKALQIFSERALDKAEDAFLPKLKRKEFKAALLAYGQQCHDLIHDYGKFPVFWIPVCIIAGAILSFLIPMRILKGKLKNIRSQPQADSYLCEDDIHMYQKTDGYLDHKVYRQMRSTNGSSGGGSSSRSSGGGSSRSSGGRGGSF